MEIESFDASCIYKTAQIKLFISASENTEDLYLPELMFMVLCNGG